MSPEIPNYGMLKHILLTSSVFHYYHNLITRVSQLCPIIILCLLPREDLLAMVLQLALCFVIKVHLAKLNPVYFLLLCCPSIYIIIDLLNFFSSTFPCSVSFMPLDMTEILQLSHSYVCHYFCFQFQFVLCISVILKLCLTYDINIKIFVLHITPTSKLCLLCDTNIKNSLIYFTNITTLYNLFH